MRVFRYWRIGLGAAIGLSYGLAFATDPVPTYPECDHQPTESDLEGAKGAHKAAAQFYERGDYDKAIRYWNDAYGLDCTAHGVLINIANSYEKAGNKRAAVATLETYLNRAGANPTIEQKVKNLKQAIEAEAAPSASASASAVPTASASAVPLPTASVPPPLVRPYGNAPWVVVGGGGVSALAGGILMAVGTGAIADAEEKCPTRTGCAPDVVSQGNAGRLQTGIGAVALGVGGAAIAGGLVWQFVFNKPSPSTTPSENTGRVKLTPQLGPTQAGLSVSGSF